MAQAGTPVGRRRSGCCSCAPDALRARQNNGSPVGQQAGLQSGSNSLRTRAGSAEPAAAAAVLYAVGSPETYRLLVVDRGWSGDRFEHWYGETLERLFLDPVGAF